MTAREGFECDLCKRREWHDLPNGLPDGWRTSGGSRLHICGGCIARHGGLLTQIVKAANAVADPGSRFLSDFVVMISGQWIEQQEKALKKAEVAYREREAT